MKTFAFVFARGGSKGVPNKNIRTLGGKPLLAYSIEMARQILEIQRVFVSTEDMQIAKIAEEWGASVIHRPADLAKDDSAEWLAWRHAVHSVEEDEGQFDIFVSLPTTSPLRNKGDVEACLALLDDQTDMVIAISATTRSPWFNMVHMTEDHSVRLILGGDKPYIRRQDVPEAFDITTVAYVTRPQFIRERNGIFEGRVKAIKIPQERALDIDTELDFQIAEFLWSKNDSNSVGEANAK